MTIMQTWSRRRGVVAIVVLTAATVGAVVHAQNPARDRSGFGTSASYEEYLQGGPARVSELVGKRVRDTGGRTVGQVADVVLGKNELALIVSVRGLRDIGDKLIARPLEDFRVAADGSELYLDVTNQQLAAEPSYSEQHTDEQAPSAAGPSAQALVLGERVGGLLGANVVDESGREIGKIDDVLVTPDAEDESRVVLAVGGIIGFGAKLVAVPFADLDVSRRPAEVGPGASPRVRLDMRADALDRLPPYEYSEREERTAAL